MNIAEIKTEARNAGIRWADVVATYKALRADENARRAYDAEIREFVWSNYCGPNSHGFWRHGMAVLFPRAFDDGDATLIPGFDKVAQEVAGIWTEFSGDNEYNLVWEFISSDYIRKTPAAELYRTALLACLAEGDDDDSTADVSFDFGCNVTF